MIEAANKKVNLHFGRLEGVAASYATSYNRQTGTYDWGGMDTEIKNMQQSGLDIVADIFFTPCWLSASGSSSNDCSAINTPWWADGPRGWQTGDYTSWKNYMAALVKHVNIDNVKAGLNKPIRYWDVWNEPSGGGFPVWTAGQFPPFWEATATAIRGADSTALVGGFSDNPAYPQNYSALFRYAQSKNLAIDFLSVHWYADWNPLWLGETSLGEPAGSPQLYFDHTQKLMALYKTYFPNTPPVFFTEWNLDSQSLIETQAQHAAYMAAALYWMQTSPYVTGANYFRMEEYPLQPPGGQYGTGNRSMLNSAYQIIEPGRVLTMFSMLPVNQVQATFLNTNGITALAAKDDSRSTLATMISNTGTATTDLILSFQGLDSSKTCTTTVYIEDSTTPLIGDLSAASTATGSCSQLTPQIMLSGSGVTLVQVTWQ